MLDHPEKTERLLAALKAAAPFDVQLTPTLIKYGPAGAFEQNITVMNILPFIS